MTLIGYWPLNETTGNTAHDYSGRDNHGTVNNGGDSTVLGNSIAPTGENAYLLDGSNDYITTPPSSFSNELTVSMWVKFESDTRSHLFQSQDNNSSTNTLVDLQRRPDRTVRVQARDDSGNDGYFTTSNTVPNNKWRLIVFTASSSGNDLKLYIDSEEISSVSPGYTDDFNASNTQTIGASNGGGSTHDGAVSEVRIYDHALTPREIQYLYQVSQSGRLTTGKRRI